MTTTPSNADRASGPGGARGGPPEPARRRLFVVTPGFEAALAAELPADLRASVRVDLPGLMSVVEPPASGVAAPPIETVFARQQLPAAVEISAPSVALLAEAAYAAVADAVDSAGAAGQPFTFHAFAPAGAEPGLGSRAALVAREALARLQQRRRRAARRYLPPEEATPRFAQAESAETAATAVVVVVVVQVLLVARDRGWVSVAAPRPLARGGYDIAPFPGGVAPVKLDRAPPSRAYRKLEEAFLWMGQAPRAGQTCVDLGAAPGGWSAAALARGASVTAVDRAPLEPPVVGHPRLQAIRGNAFTFRPPHPADWLLSDVVCEPPRTLALILDWTAARLCQQVVATIKFKGDRGYGFLGDARAALQATGWAGVRLLHLHHNKNEVTVLMWGPPA